MEKLNELVSIQSPVKALRLQDELGKRRFHQDMKKFFQPVTKSIKDVSEDETKTVTEGSTKNKETLATLNKKLSETMNDRGIRTSYLLSPSSKVNNPEHTGQFKLVQGPSSNRFNDLLINKTIPATLYDSLLTFRDTEKNYEWEGGLLKMITNKNYNVDLVKLSKKNYLFEFAK